MKFGVYFSFRKLPGDHKPWAEVYEENFAQMRLAEELGFDGVWLTEHHFSDDGYSPSVLPIAAAAAAQTSTIDIGVFIALLPLYNPVRLAEDAATVDVISRGRLILGLSAGYVASEFAALGVDFDRRSTIADEALEVLHGCWSVDNYSFSGEHFTVSDVSIYPKPHSQPHPRIFYGGGSPAGQRRHRFVVEAMNWSKEPELLWLYISDGFDKAWDEWGEGASHVHARYRRWTEESGGSWWDADPRFHFIAGDVDTAIGAIENKLGGFRAEREGEAETLVLGMNMPGVDHDKTCRSMELFATQVMPQFK